MASVSTGHAYADKVNWANSSPSTLIQAAALRMMRVRIMGIVTIVRMQTASQLKRLRAYMGPTVQAIPSHLAIRWAVRELTGEILPGPEVGPVSVSGWFLESLDENIPPSP